MKEKESGQGMVEYLIIVALIAIAAIGVVVIFGNDIKALFNEASAARQSKQTCVPVYANESVRNYENSFSEGIMYFKDYRVNQCYAVGTVRMVFTNVPCTPEVEKLLVNKRVCKKLP